MEIEKQQKWKMQKKWTFWQEQLAQMCSQIVFFFFSFLCFFKFCMFSWTHYKNRGFGPPKKKQKNNKVYKLKIGPIIC